MATKHSPLTLENAVSLLRPLALLIGLAGAIAVGIGLFTWARGSVYAQLYSGLSDKAAAEVTGALDASSVPYKLGPGPGQVRVPESSLTEARLALASQGLPAKFDSGFDFMNEGASLGVSQFVENARYQHALETELARTISSIRQVSSARVHLAVPKASAFSRDRRQASASVMLEMFPGASLAPPQVQAIVNLVATGIPNLDPKHVSVVDQTGHLLSMHDGNQVMEMAANQFQLARTLENSLSQRISSLLLPLTGPGRFSVQVHADMDFTETEQASESFKPDAQAIRSEQLSERSNSAATASGVPGAASNQPKGSGASKAPAELANENGAGSSTRTRSRNYEIDRAVSYTKGQVGQLERLTVAVLVDDLPRVMEDGKTVNKPISEDELQRISGLVRDAVGFNKERGDSVTVLNASFMPAADLLPIEPPPLWELPWARDFARNGVGLIALLALVFGVMRPTTRLLFNTPIFSAVGGSHMATLASPDDLVDDRTTLRRADEQTGKKDDREPLSYEQRLQVARDLIREDPKRVAQVVRGWVHNDG